MRTIIFISLLLVTSVNLSYSQNGWFYQSSSVNSRITDMFFIDSQTGWAAAEFPGILKTTNGGTNWAQYLLQDTIPVSTLFFINANTGWTAGGKYYLNHFGSIGRISKTTNGGVNWTVITSFPEIRSLYFISEFVGFAGIDRTNDFSWSTSGSILNTSTGGISWNDFHVGYGINSLSFINSNTGYAFGYYWDDTMHDSLIVYRTVNGGGNWVVKYSRSASYYTAYEGEVCALDDNVWVTGLDSFIVHSSNGGTSWENQLIPGYKNKNSIFFIDGNTGWAVGNSFDDTAKIIKTTDGGANWFKLRNSYNNPLYTVFFVDQYTGWAAGNNGIILKTITGGLTSVNEQTSIVIQDYRLHQNYPNPFNPNTKIFYDLNKTGYVSLKVYDLHGRKIKTLVNKKHVSGNYEVKFDAENLASGIYIYKLEVDDLLIDSKKMVLIR